MSKEAFEHKLREIEGLREAGNAAAAPLRKALKERNNYVVSKAAAIAGDLRLQDLAPDLAAAFDRFLADPLKTDPQCWAKTAIAKALRDLGHRDPSVFLRGMAHVQLEPVWGGREDSAGTLRGACTHALVETDLAASEALLHIADLLADPVKTVRIDAARAIAQLGLPAGAVPLRLKALLGDSEPEVAGECLAALLSLAPRSSIAFVARFLEGPDPGIAAEAAAVLAQSPEPEALERALGYWRTTRDRSVLAAFGASPQLRAAEFLLEVLETHRGEAADAALDALRASRFHAALQDRIADIESRRKMRDSAP